MWFLWGLITFLVIMFSTSQLISYYICFKRYPELTRDMSEKNKSIIIGGCVLHIIINLTWVIVIFSVPSIIQSYVSIIIAIVIGLIFSISGINNDTSLYKNFKELTGVVEKERKEIIKNTISKITDNITNTNIVDNTPVDDMGSITNDDDDDFDEEFDEDNKDKKV